MACPGAAISTADSRSLAADGAVHDFSKVFNDPVHGHIELDELCVQFIDTPQFQRLRELKQMGASCYVFPGATHTRFEHSIGVCHLAGEMVAHLRKKQPELGISDSDARCVRLAALCHDLGHGPFSHLFDGHFLPVVADRLQSEGRDVGRLRLWKHEEGSEMVLEHLVRQNGITAISSEELQFIKDLIRGRPRSNYPQASKRYLFEIVANERNSVDVDKLDYIQRDCMHMGLKPSIEALRYIKFARVIDGQICFHQKEAINLCELFSVRYSLFKRVYTHKVSTAIEYMINDALLAADKVLRISDCIEDPEAYTLLNDTILCEIERSRDPRMQQAQKILSQLRRRELYRMADMVILPSVLHNILDKSHFSSNRIVAAQDPDLANGPNALHKDDMIVQWLSLSYGMKNRHPLDAIRFYSKYNNSESFLVPRHVVSEFIPDHSQEIMIRVFARNRHKTAEIQYAFRRLLESINRKLDKDMQIVGIEHAHHPPASKKRHNQELIDLTDEHDLSAEEAQSSAVMSERNAHTSQDASKKHDSRAHSLDSGASETVGHQIESIPPKTQSNTQSASKMRRNSSQPIPPSPFQSTFALNLARSISDTSAANRYISAKPITDSPQNVFLDRPHASWYSSVASGLAYTDQSQDQHEHDGEDNHELKHENSPFELSRFSPGTAARLMANHGLSMPNNFEEFESPHKRRRK